MFDVYDVESKIAYRVYGVKAVNNVGGGYNTMFLFHLKGKWIWKCADKYEPKS